MAVRRCKKEDLKRIARATGGKKMTNCNKKIILSLSSYLATMVVSLSNMEGEETFDVSLLGQADTVVQERICDDEMILIKG